MRDNPIFDHAFCIPVTDTGLLERLTSSAISVYWVLRLSWWIVGRQNDCCFGANDLSADPKGTKFMRYYNTVFISI